ncbi:MAG: ankyrin repeat domain-containing protein [Phycisphaerales bacterium]
MYYTITAIVLSCFVVPPICFFAVSLPWSAWISSAPFPPIHRAATNGDTGSIKRELDSGVLVDLPTFNVGQILDGTTPLMLACGEGQVEAVELLIERGADVLARNSGGATALHFSIYSDSDSTLVLLKGGADVDIQSVNGLTPLMQAAAYGRLSQVEVLLGAGADLLLTDDQGQSALDWARQMRRHRAVELLESAMRGDATEGSSNE